MNYNHSKDSYIERWCDIIGNWLHTISWFNWFVIEELEEWNIKKAKKWARKLEECIKQRIELYEQELLNKQPYKVIETEMEFNEFVKKILDNKQI